MGKFAPVLIGLLTRLNEVERELTQERTLASIAYRKQTGLAVATIRKIIERNKEVAA